MLENGQIGIGSIGAPLAPGEDAAAQYFFTGSEIDDQERDTRARRKGAKHIPLPALEEGRVDDNPMAGFDNDACQIEQPAVSRLGRFGTVQAFGDAGARTVFRRKAMNPFSFNIGPDSNRAGKLDRWLR